MSTLLNCRQRYTLTSSLLAVKRNTPSSPHWWLWKGIQPHVQTAGVERVIPSRQHCWLWKGIQPHVHLCWGRKGIHPHFHTLLVVERDTPSFSHPAGGGKGYTLISTPCWWWKGIHPHVHTLLVVERDTPSCSHPAGGGKGYTLTPTLLTVDSGNDNTPTSTLLVCGKEYTHISINAVMPASVFWHQGQFRYRWSQISPALPSYAFHTLQAVRSRRKVSLLYLY